MAQMDPRMAQAMAARQQQQGGRPQGRPMPPQAQGRPQGRPMPPQGGGAPQGGGQNQIMQALAQIMQMLQVLIRQQGGGAPQGMPHDGQPNEEE